MNSVVELYHRHGETLPQLSLQRIPSQKHCQKVQQKDSKIDSIFQCKFPAIKRSAKIKMKKTAL